MKRKIIVVIFLLAGFTLHPIVAYSQGEALCGSLENHFGPFDYRTTFGEQKYLVEMAHFRPETESLRLEHSHRGYVDADLDYTLRAFPNHHRALLAMMKYSFKKKLKKTPAARYSVSCYFDRAIRFAADDGMVRVLFATYLQKTGDNAEALEQMKAAELNPVVDPNFFYNAGLVFFNLGNYSKALDYAHKAQTMGFPLQGLKSMLEKAGQWREPSPEGSSPEKSANEQ